MDVVKNQMVGELHAIDPRRGGKDPTSEKEELAFTPVQKIANLQIHLQAGDEHGG